MISSQVPPAQRRTRRPGELRTSIALPAIVESAADRTGVAANVEPPDRWGRTGVVAAVAEKVTAALTAAG